MTCQENKLLIRRFVDEVINGKNLDAIETLFADEFVERVPFPGQGPGRKGVRYTIKLFLDAFPDIQGELDEQIAEANTVVSRFTWSGTHRGFFLGIGPTGRKVRVSGVVFDTVKEGKVVESRTLMDAQGLMHQLG